MSPAFVSLSRTLGNQTPILNSWAGDGTYWVTNTPKVTNYYAVTYASVFGDDPNPKINRLGKQVVPAPAASQGIGTIDGLVEAISGERPDERPRPCTHAGGFAEGADDGRQNQLLAEPAQRVRTAIPRDRVQDNKGSRADSRTAKVVPKI